MLLVTPGGVRGLATGGLRSVQNMVNGNHLGSVEEGTPRAYLRPA